MVPRFNEGRRGPTWFRIGRLLEDWYSKTRSRARYYTFRHGQHRFPFRGRFLLD